MRRIRNLRLTQQPFYYMYHTCILFYSRLIGNPIKELSGEIFLYNKRLDAL